MYPASLLSLTIRRLVCNPSAVMVSLIIHRPGM